MTFRAITSRNSVQPAVRAQRWSHGQTLVEFATVALPLMFIMFGIITLSLTLYAYSFVCESARDAVRYAIVHGAASTAPATSTDIQNYVINEAHGLNSTELTISTNWNPNNNPGSVVSVQVTYDFQPLFPMSSVTLPLTSTSQMVISQ